MIAFLTLLYCGVLFLLVRLGVIRLNLFWKASPLIWMALLLVVLFIPMQWGAPSGPVTLYRTVVEVVPNVSGEVVDVPVKSLTLLKEGDVLFQIDPRPFQYSLDQLQAELVRATATQKLTAIELARNVEAAKANAVAALDVDMWRAREAVASAEVRSLEAQIDRAKWDLDQTTTRAPDRGYVVGLMLRPGQRVTKMVSRAWMAFVDERKTLLVAGIQQYALRNVEPGQQAEVVFKVRPGETFAATVTDVSRISSQGQMAPSGEVPDAPAAAQAPEPFGVILELEGGVDVLREIPAGSVGTAAIYTQSVRATHLIRRIMLRMQTFMNYVVPS